MNNEIRHDRTRVRLFWLLLVLTHGAVVWGGFQICLGNFTSSHLTGLLSGYFLRAIGVTVVLHRMITHGSIVPHPWVRQMFYVLGCFPLQGELCFWAGMHRAHHADPDGITDPHSPQQKGFWYSHVGWLIRDKTPEENSVIERVRQEHPGAARIDRHFLLWGLLPFAISAYWGYEVFLWFNLVALALVFHITWCVNSVAHLIGLKPHKFTPGESRNLALPVIRLAREARSQISLWIGAMIANSLVYLTNLIIGIIFVGENLHGGHHASQRSPKFGRGWEQPDPGFWCVLLLRKIGLITAMSRPAI